MNLTKAIEIIKQFEGLKLEAYLCSAGVPTIGYGTTKYIDGSKVKLGDKISLVEAEHILLADVGTFAVKAKALIKPELTENQFAAVVSLVYNIGIGAFSKSTLLKCLNEEIGYKNEYQDWLSDCSNEFLKWNKAGGKVVQGLVNRRKAERDLFLS